MIHATAPNPLTERNLMRHLVLLLLVVIPSAAWAEEPASSLGDLKGLAMMLVPALWGAIGPMAMAGITKAVNGLVGAYVPRPVQVIVSSLLGAVVAGVAGDVSTAAGAASAVGAAVTGGTAQVYAGVKPETLHTSAPPVTLGGPVS